MKVKFRELRSDASLVHSVWLVWLCLGCADCAGEGRGKCDGDAGPEGKRGLQQV